jgi:uncharacterized protein YndB with AHSA1/START domain
MSAFELEREIGRAPQFVWAALSDVRRTPEWYEAVSRVVPLGDGVAELGARFELHRSLPSGPVVNVVEITEYVPLERFTLASRTGPTPFTYRYSLSPSGSGTRLVLHGDISADGLPGPAARLGVLATALFKNGMRTNLAALARLIEAG